MYMKMRRERHNPSPNIPTMSWIFLLMPLACSCPTTLHYSILYCTVYITHTEYHHPSMCNVPPRQRRPTCATLPAHPHPAAPTAPGKGRLSPSPTRPPPSQTRSSHCPARRQPVCCFPVREWKKLFFKNIRFTKTMTSVRDASLATISTSPWIGNWTTRSACSSVLYLGNDKRRKKISLDDIQYILQF